MAFDKFSIEKINDTTSVCFITEDYLSQIANDQEESENVSWICILFNSQKIYIGIKFLFLVYETSYAAITDTR